MSGEQEEQTYGVLRVQGKKWEVFNGRAQWLYLVKWMDTPTDRWSLDKHDSWEPEQNLRYCPEAIEEYESKVKKREQRKRARERKRAEEGTLTTEKKSTELTDSDTNIEENEEKAKQREQKRKEREQKRIGETPGSSMPSVDTGRSPINSPQTKRKTPVKKVRAMIESSDEEEATAPLIVVKNETTNEEDTELMREAKMAEEARKKEEAAERRKNNKGKKKNKNKGKRNTMDSESDESCSEVEGESSALFDPAFTGPLLMPKAESLTAVASPRRPFTEPTKSLLYSPPTVQSLTLNEAPASETPSSSSSVQTGNQATTPPTTEKAPEKKSIKFADSEKYKNLRAGIDPEGRLTTIRMDALGRPYTVPYDPVQAEKDEKEGKKRGLMLIGKRADGSFARAFDDINHPALGFNRKAQGKIVIEEKICTFEGQRFALFAFRELKQFQFVHIDIAKRVALDEFFKLAQHPDFRRK